jgi:hypothetical protein
MSRAFFLNRYKKLEEDSEEMEWYATGKGSDFDLPRCLSLERRQFGFSTMRPGSSW